MGLVAFLYVTRELAERSGLISWAKAAVQASSTLVWAVGYIVGQIQGAKEYLPGSQEEFNEITGLHVSQWEAMLAPVGFTTMCCAVAFFWDELKENFSETPSTSPVSSPTTSVGNTPATSEDEDVSDPVLGRHAAKALGSLSRNQERLAQQLEEMQTDARRDRMLRNVMRTDSAPMPTPASGEASSTMPKTVEDMMKRLDAFEEMMQRDRSPTIARPEALTRAEESLFTPNQDARGDPDSIVAFKGNTMKTLESPDSSNLRSAPASGANPGGSTPDQSGKVKGKVSTIILQLERLNHNPQQAWLDALKEFCEVPPEEWPMPVGFKSRIAPEYFFRVYSSPKPGIEHGQKWAEEHGCIGCSWIKGYMDALACVDRLLLGDKPPNLVNSISLEYLAWKAHTI